METTKTITFKVVDTGFDHSPVKCTVTMTEVVPDECRWRTPKTERVAKELKETLKRLFATDRDVVVKEIVTTITTIGS